MSCLAEPGDQEFRRLAAHSTGDKIWELARFRVTSADCRQRLRATPQRGYGVRISSFVGVAVIDDGLDAIARPNFAGQYLADLKDAKQAISAALGHALGHA